MCKNKVINKFIVSKIMICPSPLEAVFSIMVVYNIPLQTSCEKNVVFNAYIKQLIKYKSYINII